MAQRFELFRLALIERPQADLLSDDRTTREVYLREIFSQNVEFQYYGKKYFFVAAPDIIDPIYIMGRIGREALENENLPPEDGLVETTHNVWRALIMFLDPRSHSDGQKAAVSIDQKIGSSFKILETLCNHINDINANRRWTISVSQTINKGNFWEFIKENEGKISSATFEFVAPNMFGGGDSASRETRRFRDQEKAERIKVTLSSSKHLELDNARIRDAVAYIEAGQGKMKARTTEGKTFNSEDTKEIRRIEDVVDKKAPLTRTLSERLKEIGLSVKNILG